ncbi:MAG: GH92 family glycosyl hydrolase, partial [Bacteroidales bacterium]|nr:GH92 family glycosyl hydrolase [Bacteroidales bacterium]
MNRITKIIKALLLLASFYGLTSCVQPEFTKYIDPTIGNVAPFLVPTYPTMHLPNQMIRMYPIKQDYLSDQVEAFPLQVTSHRQSGIFRMKLSSGEIKSSMRNKKMNIDHDLEVYHPWFYSTYLIDDDIRVSYVPGSKSAIYKIDFSGSGQKNLMISGSENMECEFDNQGTFRFKEETGETTKGLNPVKLVVKVYVYGELHDENNNLIKDASVKIQNGWCSVSFSKSSPESVFIRYAVSYISYDQAKNNFEGELTNVSFEDMMESGKKAWEKVINQIEVKGGTEAQRRTFYTSLYRTYERMVDINEGGRYYSGYDGKIHDSNRPFYVDDWVWDTFRAHHPLRTILDPQMENDILNSYTLMYEQSGWMPTFPQVFGNHMCMNAYHSSAIFIDGYRKGLRDYNVEKAYEGIRKNLMEGTFIPWRQGTERRPIDDFFHENGYFPALYPGEKETEPQVDSFEKRQPVAVTLGVSYNFWNLGQFAYDLGKTADYEKFSNMGESHKNLWHPEHRLFMPKDDNGEWID